MNDTKLSPAEQRKERARRLAEDPTLAPHGSHSTYNYWGCRCEPCTDAMSAYYQRRLTPRTAREVNDRLTAIEGWAKHAQEDRVSPLEAVEAMAGLAAAALRIIEGEAA